MSIGLSASLCEDEMAVSGVLYLAVTVNLDWLIFFTAAFVTQGNQYNKVFLFYFIVFLGVWGCK